MADTISTLPDAILCHILSFLPTKHAVATSVLSKRWNPLWRSIPTLDFDDLGYTKATYSHFVQSVYTFIVSRHLHKPIQTFRLRCGSKSLCDPNNVNAWVNAAAQLRVQHLDLSLHFMNPKMDLPSVVLSCRTLGVLKLAPLSVKAFSSLDFPLLKILHFNGVSFLDHKHLAEFLSACPNLVDLEAKYLYFHDESSEAEFESLPKLVRADIVRYDVQLKAVSNVEFLRVEWVDFLALAPGELNIALYPCHRELIPMFQNLTNIELIYIDYNVGYLLRLVEMLKHCPKLQKLAIDKVKENLHYFTDVNDYGDWPYDFQPVPKCLSSHLKTCCLNNYMGSGGELEFARYTLSNARRLQTMTICSTSDRFVNQRKKLRMMQELSWCTRHSAACRLPFK